MCVSLLGVLAPKGGRWMTKALGFALVSACGAMIVSAQQPSAEVSYFREIRPVIQRSCQGCHQPAMKYGGPDLTRFQNIAAGGGERSAIKERGRPESALGSHIQRGPKCHKAVLSARRSQPQCRQ